MKKIVKKVNEIIGTNQNVSVHLIPKIKMEHFEYNKDVIDIYLIRKSVIEQPIIDFLQGVYNCYISPKDVLVERIKLKEVPGDENAFIIYTCNKEMFDQLCK